ncbi:MAG: MFS transporter [Anaerolineales bacterium]|nr:MFS transporter [Anaerolineales bacterium]
MTDHIVQEKTLSPAFVIMPLGFAVCVSLFGDLALFAVLPTRTEVIGISVASLGVIFGIHRLIRIPGNPIGGLFINKGRRKTYFLAGMLLAFISTLGYGMVTGLLPFILLRITWGCAWILIYISSMTMLIDVTTTGNRGKWNGIYNIWYLFGIAGGSLAGGYLADVIGYQQAMYVCAGMTLVGVLVSLFIPESNPKQNFRLLGDERQKTHPIKTLQQLWTSTVNTIKNTPGMLIIVLLYMITQFVGEGVALSTISLLLKEKFGEFVSFSWTTLGIASVSGMLISARYILSGVSSPLVGNISDQLNNRKLLLSIGMFLGIASFLVIGYSSSLQWITLGILLNAISGSALLVLLGALLGDISSEGAEGQMVGIYATFGDMGSALGPLFAYLILPIVNLPTVYMLCGVLFLIGLALTQRIEFA